MGPSGHSRAFAREDLVIPIDSAGFRRFLDARAAAAAFLAALELKNVVAGSMFQIENPGPIYFIYFALIIANFLIYGMASVLVKPRIKHFSLPQALLMPSAGRVRREPQLFDVYVMLAGILPRCCDGQGR